MCVIMSMDVLMPSWSYLLLMSNVLFIHSLEHDKDRMAYTLYRVRIRAARGPLTLSQSLLGSNLSSHMSLSDEDVTLGAAISSGSDTARGKHKLPARPSRVAALPRSCVPGIEMAPCEWSPGARCPARAPPPGATSSSPPQCPTCTLFFLSRRAVRP